MRFSTVAFTLVGATASVSASSLFARQNLPNCAVACTTSADLGGCVVSDTHCLCTNQAFVSSTTSCIEAACSGSDLQAALAYSQGLCLKVGVTLAAPSSTPAASSTSGASNSSSASGASATPTSPSSSASAPAASNTTSSSATSHGVNAVLGLAAAGLLSLAL